MAASPAVVEAAKDAGLRYVTDSMPGISRSKSGAGFSYRSPNGSLLRDPEELDRIQKLAIPPAYRNVWICPDSKGHLQATGMDDRGRKQYRYHARFREVQEENKFQRMAEFGKILPSIRERIDQDLARRGLPKEKVVAVVVYLLERSLIRVGNEEYAKQNKSYGLTTMLTRHVKIEGQKIQFRFLGKSKTKHQIEIHDRRLARVVKKIQELPGQELLHYLDEAGEARCVSSVDVNQYLQEITGEHFTAKDFRTWWGTLLAFTELSCRSTPDTKIGVKRAVTDAMRSVSRQLGNTPTICRKCYVHPQVVAAFTSGGLGCENVEEGQDDESLLAGAESKLLEFLNS